MAFNYNLIVNQGETFSRTFTYKAGGVVVNVGGQISHAVIVCRELGLPCVVSATDATSRIPDGATIEVNGDTGVVTIIST